jgi:predicted ATP-dependent Lon-type protease
VLKIQFEALAEMDYNLVFQELALTTVVVAVVQVVTEHRGMVLEECQVEQVVVVLAEHTQVEVQFLDCPAIHLQVAVQVAAVKMLVPLERTVDLA